MPEQNLYSFTRRRQGIIRDCVMDLVADRTRGQLHLRPRSTVHQSNISTLRGNGVLIKGDTQFQYYSSKAPAAQSWRRVGKSLDALIDSCNVDRYFLALGLLVKIKCVMKTNADARSTIVCTHRPH